MVLRCCSPHSSQSLDAVLCILHSVQNTVSVIHCTSVLHKLPRGGRAVERGSMRMGGSELRRRRAWPQPLLKAVVVRWWQRQGPSGVLSGMLSSGLFGIWLLFDTLARHRTARSRQVANSTRQETQDGSTNPRCHLTRPTACRRPANDPMTVSALENHGASATRSASTCRGGDAVPNPARKRLAAC